jgi:predicted alpha/beta superfamily hydrolase
MTFQSDVLEEERILNVYLPPEYQMDSTRQFPVIYLLDGSMEEDFIHVTGLVQFYSLSWINLIEPHIVVGIANVDRKRDLTFPTNNEADKKQFPTTGRSATFIQAIEKDIKPVVNSTYRTSDKSTLIGQSLGGLLATEILFNHPNLFTDYIIVSPSLWWNDQSLLDASANPTAKKNIFIAVGKEEEIMETDAKALHTKLSELPDSPYRVGFAFMPNRDHGDALHEAVYRAFEFFNPSF